MKIESKYEIGTEFWVIYKEGRGIVVYKDKIKEIVVLRDGIEYIGEDTLDGVREENIVVNKAEVLFKAMNEMAGE